MPSASSTRKTAATPARPRAVGKAKSKKGVSKASDFKKNKAASKVDLELPSGNVCLVKRPGITELIAKGLFSDALLPLVQNAIISAKTGKKTEAEIDMSELMSDPKKLADVMDTYDRLLPMVVVEPKVVYHKYKDGDEIPEGSAIGDEILDEERNEELVYTDEVELDDKLFIFQYVVGGTADIASFREQSGKAVAALSDGEDVSVSSV